ncbi:hypothetical protein LD39_04665 [Halobacillus sp. BBL2006]|nr:hypothetical protein LD39_04665 [Halobacillus sp. BBL2006]
MLNRTMQMHIAGGCNKEKEGNNLVGSPSEEFVHERGEHPVLRLLLISPVENYALPLLTK